MLKYEDQSLITSSKKRILVVEDDIQMSKFIQFKLNYMGYEVAGTAVNSSEALERSRSLKPDMILMDIMLEGSSDGIETAQQIIAQQHVPIIYLTAYEDEVLFDRAKITEPFGYLIKPFNDRDLRIVLETSLYRHEQDKRIHQALQDVRNVLNSSLDMMITFNFDGDIIEFNRVAEDLFGLKRSTARKLSIVTLLKSQRDSTIILDGDPEAIHKHEQIVFLDVNGNDIPREIVLTPLKNKEGKLLGRLLVCRSE